MEFVYEERRLVGVTVASWVALVVVPVRPRHEYGGVLYPCDLSCRSVSSKSCDGALE